jgi:hypothetical protein
LEYYGAVGANYGIASLDEIVNVSPVINLTANWTPSYTGEPVPTSVVLYYNRGYAAGTENGLSGAYGWLGAAAAVASPLFNTLSQEHFNDDGEWYQNIGTSWTATTVTINLIPNGNGTATGTYALGYGLLELHCRAWGSLTSYHEAVTSAWGEYYFTPTSYVVYGP